MVSSEATLEQVRRIYKRLSILVHPDKNLDDKERAQKAFDAINKAYKMFGDEEQIQFCRDVAEEAKKQLDKRLEEKRAKTKKEGKDGIEEDDPEKVTGYHGDKITLFYMILYLCLLYTSPSPRDRQKSRMPSSA